MAKFSWDTQQDAPTAQAKGGKFSWDEQQDVDASPDKGPGFLERAGRAALEGAAYVGEKVDRYTGAPTRAAIGAAQDAGSLNPFEVAGAGLKAGASQFSEDPRLAPTGKDLAKKTGLSDQAMLSPEQQRFASSLLKGTPLGFMADKLAPGAVERAATVSPAGVAGVGLDVAADPTLLIPGGAGLLGKLTGKSITVPRMSSVAREVAGVASRSAGKVGEAASAFGRAAENVGVAAVKKAGGLMTGVPEKEIETYIRKYPEVQKMIAEHGDDIAGAADKIREGYQASIRGKRAALGSKVGEAIEALPKDKAVDIAPVIDQLEQVKSRMNKTLRFEEVKQVDDLIDRLKQLSTDKGPMSETAALRGVKEAPIGVSKGEVGSLTGKGTEYLTDPKTGEVMAQFQDGKMVTESGSTVSPEMAAQSTVITPANMSLGGKITPKEMYEVKQFLQERGKGSFMKDGQIFMPGTDAQLAAKNASRTARDIVNTMSPTVADANKEISALHRIEENKRLKNLITPGASDADLVAAGAGDSARANRLRVLGQATGQDMLGEAEKFAAMKRFAHPGFSAVDSTGKAVERMGKAGLVGLGLGGIPGAAIAAGLTSPLALKTAIQAGRIPVQAIKKLAGVTGALSDATIQKAYQVLKTPEGQKAFEAALQGAKVESIEGRAGMDMLQQVAQGDQNRAVAAEPKGEARWAQQGGTKLGLDTEALKKAMSSKEGRNLLIEASDLKPGSPKLTRIRARLKERGGQ